MANEEYGYDPESEMVETNMDLFLAARAFEECNQRAYLEHLRKAQAHLTGLIMDAEAQGTD